MPGLVEALEFAISSKPLSAAVESCTGNLDFPMDGLPAFGLPRGLTVVSMYLKIPQKMIDLHQFLP